jgi:hypothetical protein
MNTWSPFSALGHAISTLSYCILDDLIITRFCPFLARIVVTFVWFVSDIQ